MSADPGSPVSRRTVVAGLAAGLATLGAPAILRGRFRLHAQSPADHTEYSERAIRLVEHTLVVDMLNQFRFPDNALQPPMIERWLRRPGAFTPADWDEYKRSGFRVFGLGGGDEGHEGALIETSEWNGFVASYPDWFMRVSTGADFGRLAASGKLGILITMQNGDHFRTVDDVDLFWGLGQRASQLTYNKTNPLGSGFLADTDEGLTAYGAQVLARMEQVGMAVDLSHAADRTTLDELSAATRPVIISHGACRALMPGHLRAKTDEAIKRMAALGGVMGIPMIRFLVRLQEPVTTEHVLDHFDYMAKLVGVEHVGIGGDLDLIGNANPVNSSSTTQTVPSGQKNFDRYHFHVGDNGRPAVTGLDHSRRMYDLAEGLIRRKYSDSDITLMLGGNWQRVLTTIWRA